MYLKRVRKIRSKLLTRYVIYNFCIVLLPCALLACLYFSSVSGQVQQQLESTHSFTLNQARQAIDENLRELLVIASKLSKDRYLTPFAIRSSAFAKYEAIERMSAYHSQTAFYSELLIYYRDEGLFLSNRGEYNETIFIEKGYAPRGDWNAWGFTEFLNRAANLSISPPGCLLHSMRGEEDFIVIAITLPMFSKKPYGTAFGLVDRAYYENLMASASGDGESLYLIASGGKILFSNAGGVPEAEAIALREAASPGDLKQIRINGSTYRVVSTASQHSDWMHVLLYPAYDVWTMARIWHKELFIIYAAIIAGLALGVGVAFKNYRPIYDLSMTIDDGGKRGANELDNLRQALSNARDVLQRKSNEGEVDHKQIANRLAKYIASGYGGNFSEQDLRAQFETAGITLDGPYYCMMTMYLPQSVSLFKLEELLETLVLTEKGRLYGFIMPYSPCVAVLVSLRGTGDTRRKLVEKLMTVTAECIGIEPAIGVSNIYKKLDQLNQSLTEALAAAQTSLQTGEDPIVFFSDLAAESDDNWFRLPGKIQVKLVHALQNGNSKSAHEAISELEKNMMTKRAQGDGDLARFIGNDILSTILKLADDMGVALPNGRLMKLVGFQSVEEFTQELRAITDDYLSSIEKSDLNRQEKRYAEIKEYIDEHCCDVDISLTSIAAHFNIATSTLSRLFREMEGIRYIDYLTGQRITMACNLLKQTDWKVKDIMTQVGYLDLASFTRKFTLIVGTSPGRYRSNSEQVEP